MSQFVEPFETTPALPTIIAFIRTSDRATFRRCRRKWDWSYLHRGNRVVGDPSEPLWTGSGVHFALEDFHGLKHFSGAAEAFKAFADGWALLEQQTKGRYRRPSGWAEQLDLATGMLSYYEGEWLRNRDPLRTFMWNGRPQVEVRFEIEIPLPPELLRAAGFDKAIYQGTLDRVIIDEFDRLWIVEYKTAKRFELAHFDTDGQITAYCWAANLLYDRPIEGVVYQQHKKRIPEPPKFLKTTGAFSVAKTMATTYAMYKTALLRCYGSVERAPQHNREYLEGLGAAESGDRDDLVRRDYVRRSEAQLLSEARKILLEAQDMLDPNLRIYPNPTRDCSWDCNFQQACINRDDGGDYVYELEQNTLDRDEETDSWRTHLSLPNSHQALEADPELAAITGLQPKLGLPIPQPVRLSLPPQQLEQLTRP